MTTENVHVGDYLKQKRNERNLSLKNISQATKIHISLLEYLESNNLSKLPDQVYVKGFIKNYCKSLGIPNEEALALFNGTTNPVSNTYQSENSNITNAHLSSSKVTPQEKTEISNKSKETTSNDFSTYLVVALVIALLGFGTYYFARKKENRQNVSTHHDIESLNEVKSDIKEVPIPPTPNVPAPTPVVTPAIQPAATAPEKIEIKDQPKPEVKVQEIKAPTKPETKVEVKPEIKSEVKPEEKNTQVENSDNTVIPEKIKRIRGNGRQNIYIKAVNGESWIAFNKNNGPVQSFTLREGRSVFMTADMVKLSIKNPKAVKLFQDGKEVQFANLEKLNSFVFPKNKESENPMPLFERDSTGKWAPTTKSN